MDMAEERCGIVAVPRWLTESGISQSLNTGEWMTLIGIVWMVDENDNQRHLVSASTQLLSFTGLSRQRQSEHLRRLDGKWGLIETKRDPSRHGTLLRVCWDRLREVCADLSKLTPIPGWDDVLTAETKPSVLVNKRKRFAVFERDRFTCRYCNRTVDQLTTKEHLVVDHVSPISAGGVAEMDNLLTACTSCNIGKFNRETQRLG
jgi:hypothetical protein